MSKYLLKDKRIYYIIYTTYRKIPLFSSKIITDLFLHDFFYYYAKYRIQLFTYSIMPCHFNFMARFRTGQDIEDFERDLKSFSTNKLLFFVDNIENIDYQFLCGQNCHCNKFPKFKINVSAGSPRPARIKNSMFTQESLNIIKTRKRIWRHESWKQIIDNKKEFNLIYKYIYFNNKKHHLTLPHQRYCHKRISDL